MIGIANIEATGTSQARFVSAPAMTNAAANATRTAIVSRYPEPAVPVSPRSRATHSNHRFGSRTNEATAMTAVVARAIANDRHSRRTANQRTPTPGVIFVSSRNDQAYGQRKPSTMAAPSIRWMLPTNRSR